MFTEFYRVAVGDSVYQAACLSPGSWVEYEVFPDEISNMVLWLVMQYVDNIWTKAYLLSITTAKEKYFCFL